MRMQSFHLTVQGASHIKHQKECQDASESYRDERCAIAIVCDGHGGNDYVRSASGSSFACAAAKRNILQFVENVDREELSHRHEHLLQKLEESIISQWNDEISRHARENPWTDEEIAALSERAKRKYLQENRIESAYGTTLIAVAVTGDYWFGIHIGDGKCVAVSREGEFTQPIPWDERCFLNATTSICDSDALTRFRSFYSEKLPAAIFLGSDGIDDCFASDQLLHNFYRTVLYSFSTSEFDEAVSGLNDYLPRLSAKGSGDDMSVAAVLDLDSIGEIESVKAFDREKEKARIEEKARLAAQQAEERRLQAEAEKRRAEEQMVIQCGRCGAKINRQMTFCWNCGALIDWGGGEATMAAYPAGHSGLAAAEGQEEPVREEGADAAATAETATAENLSEPLKEQQAGQPKHVLRRPKQMARHARMTVMKRRIPLSGTSR